MKIVLDTSALLGGFEVSLKEKAYIPRSVLEEIQKGKMKKKLDILKYFLEIISPEENSKEVVMKAAKKSGDIEKLSSTDIDVMALAYEINGTILSDDYRIQNVSSILDINYENIQQEKIREEFNWEYRCSGCGRYFEKEHKECPICGSSLRITRGRNPL